MSSAIIQLLVLAGIAVFLIIRLRSVLGTRDGFEKPPVPSRTAAAAAPRPPRVRRDRGRAGPRHHDHVPDGSEAAKALAAMKMAEPGFNVGEFLDGAKGAYEMILMAFENGDLSDVEGIPGPRSGRCLPGGDRPTRGPGPDSPCRFRGVREVSLVTATSTAHEERAN
jgi:predicted lipid-binding transport protein (Tim44 family)